MTEHPQIQGRGSSPCGLCCFLTVGPQVFTPAASSLQTWVNYHLFPTFLHHGEQGSLQS